MERSSFDRPHSAEPESPDESQAMIQFAGMPALQEALRALCMEFNRYLHHNGTTTSRKSEVNGYRHRSIEVGAFKQQASPEIPFKRKQSAIKRQVDTQLNLVPSRNQEQLIGTRSTLPLNPRGSATYPRLREA